jgi:hypothetical protein
MCVIISASKAPFKLLWMQDIAFLTPGGIATPIDIGHRHVITTIAIECNETTDLYLTYAGQAEDFKDLSSTLHASSKDKSFWINEATNSGGYKKIRYLRYDSETKTIWITFYKPEKFEPETEHRGLRIRKLNFGGMWPDPTADADLVDPIRKATSDIPFTCLTLKNFPKGMSIFRISLQIRNKPLQVATGTTSFDLMGPAELRETIAGSIEVLNKLPEDIREKAHKTFSEFFTEHTKFGPSDPGIYDAIVKAYPGCSVEPISDKVEGQSTLGGVKIPWANPTTPSDEEFLAMLYSSNSGKFRVRMHVHTPLKCEHWQFPSKPTCAHPLMAAVNPKPQASIPPIEKK